MKQLVIALLAIVFCLSPTQSYGALRAHKYANGKLGRSFKPFVEKAIPNRSSRVVSPLANVSETTIHKDKAHKDGLASTLSSNESHRLLTDGHSNASRIAKPHWGTFVINLDRRPKRLQRFKEALTTYEPWLLEKGNVCRVKGRDGNLISRNFMLRKLMRRKVVENRSILHQMVVPESVEDLASLVENSWVSASAAETAQSKNAIWPAMSRGGIGLYLGHVDAWRKVWDDGLDYGLIFEDDATLFSPSFEEEVVKIMTPDSNSPSPTDSWEFLYLQRCNDYLWLKERSDWSLRDAKLPESIGKPKLVQIADRETVTCTGAYIITRSGAKKLLDGALPAEKQLDYQLGNVTGLRRVALSPPVAQCSEVVTDSNGERHRDTDVQQNQERLQKRKLEMDKAADAWLKEWRDSLNRHRTTFLAEKNMKREIPNCPS